MRIHMLNAVYPPEAATSARTAGDIAEEMTRRGHEVTVFTSFPNRPAGRLMEGYRRSLRKVEHRDGYKIVHSWHTLSRSSTILSRFAENISLGITSTVAMLREPAPGVVYVNSRPIFAQWLGVFASNWRKVPAICVVKDLYPETLIEGTGVSRNNPLARLLRFIDKQVYRRSEFVTVLNPTLREYLIADRGVPEAKVEVFQDWLDASGYSENPIRDGDFRKKHGFPSDLFLAMYVGSLTRMAGLSLYVEAAEKLRHRKDIRVLLVGDGAMRGEIEDAIAERALENIDVIYPLEPEEVPEVQAAADVLMLSLLPGAAAHTTPSKMITYMFSVRPVLASVEQGGPPAKIIEDARCGYVIDQGNAEQLADQLLALADRRESLAELGANARRYAESHFARSSVLPRVCDMIERVAERR